MDTLHKVDPAIYPKLRRQTLEMRLPLVGKDAVQLVLMDWNLGSGMATAVAAADGTASLFLSRGGGFLAGSAQHPSLRTAALHAVALATSLLSLFDPADGFPLPDQGAVTFYVTTGAGVLTAVAAEARLRAGADPLAALGGAMQRIVTEHRTHAPKRQSGSETVP